MRRAATPLIILTLALLVGCGATVRESKVLKAELSWFSSAALKQSDLLRYFVLGPQCVCNEAETGFIDPLCQKAARALLVVKHRVPWHKKMSLYNAGIIEKRPARVPPPIPAVDVLCKAKAD